MSEYGETDTGVRRRKVDFTGSSFSTREMDMATILYNTYKQERRRYEMQTGRPSSYEGLKWENDFAISASGTNDENVENMKRDGKPRSNRRTVWFAVAKRITPLRINPQAYIRRVFFFRDPDAGVPNPEYFDTRKAVEDYEQAGQLLDKEIGTAFRSSIDKFEVEMVKTPKMLRDKGNEYVWAYVISDSLSGFGALFRYCMGVRLMTDPNCHNPEMFQRIVDRFSVDAAMEYLFAADLYDRHWKGLLPNGYRQRANDIYDTVFSRPGAVGDEHESDF